MAKHTPFFKFDSSAWLGGSIQFTDLQSKGLFIDLCALYWETEKPVKIDTKFKVRIRCLEGTLNEILGTLSDLDIIVQTEHGITIPFLDSLMSERKDWLDKCSKAGKKSGINKGTSSNKKEERREKKEDSRVKESTKEKSTRFTPPTIEEIKAYCLERKNNVDANKWMNHYEAKGWMIGKGKMKSWKAAVRTWEEKEVKQLTGQDLLNNWKA